MKKSLAIASLLFALVTGYIHMACTPRAKTAVEAVNAAATAACQTVYESDESKAQKYCKTLDKLQPFIKAIELAKAEVEGVGQGPEGSNVSPDAKVPGLGMAAE